jgi:hypothetical protein
MYSSAKIKLTEHQKKQIQKSHQMGQGVSVKLTKNALVGDDEVKLTKTQMKSLEKARLGGKGIVLNVSRTQMKGGFLGAFASLIPSLVSTLVPMGVNALASLIGGRSVKDKKKTSPEGQGIRGYGLRVI